MSDIKPVIFLDIDGALWTFNTMLPKDEYGYTFDRPCVTALGWLIEHSQASVVLSSSWRIAGLATMCQMWADRDLPGKLISITPDLHSMVNPHFINNPYLLSRGYEIETWLKQNNNPEYFNYRRPSRFYSKANEACHHTQLKNRFNS